MGTERDLVGQVGTRWDMTALQYKTKQMQASTVLYWQYSTGKEKVGTKQKWGSRPGRKLIERAALTDDEQIRSARVDGRR